MASVPHKKPRNDRRTSEVEVVVHELNKVRNKAGLGNGLLAEQVFSTPDKLVGCSPDMDVGCLPDNGATILSSNEEQAHREALQRIVARGFRRIEEVLDDMSPRDLGWVTAVCFDKLRILTGKPTIIKAQMVLDLSKYRTGK